MKTALKTCRRFLVAAVLLAIVLPGPALAQEPRTDLTFRIVSGEYLNRLEAGKEHTYYLEVQNHGAGAITNLKFVSEKPEGWNVEFRPAEIARLTPGSLQTVAAAIMPAHGAEKGEYRLTLIAESSEIRRVETIWVRVEGYSYWLWIGVGIAVLLVAAFIAIFVRYGRQPT